MLLDKYARNDVCAAATLWYDHLRADALVNETRNPQELEDISYLHTKMVLSILSQEGYKPAVLASMVITNSSLEEAAVIQEYVSRLIRNQIPAEFLPKSLY